MPSPIDSFIHPFILSPNYQMSKTSKIFSFPLICGSRERYSLKCFLSISLPHSTFISVSKWAQKSARGPEWASGSPGLPTQLCTSNTVKGEDSCVVRLSQDPTGLKLVQIMFSSFQVCMNFPDSCLSPSQENNFSFLCLSDSTRLI